MVKRRGFVPGRGDVIWIDMPPQAGQEQAVRRPALVLSPYSYNGKTSLAVLCPITSQIKGYPFEVHLPEGFSLRGSVLSDQVRCLDWLARNASLEANVTESVVSDVLARIAALIGVE